MVGLPFPPFTLPLLSWGRTSHGIMRARPFSGRGPEHQPSVPADRQRIHPPRHRSRRPKLINRMPKDIIKSTPSRPRPRSSSHTKISPRGLGTGADSPTIKYNRAPQLWVLLLKGWRQLNAYVFSLAVHIASKKYPCRTTGAASAASDGTPQPWRHTKTLGLRPAPQRFHTKTLGLRPQPGSHGITSSALLVDKVMLC